jgi:dihydrofolate reductase
MASNRVIGDKGTLPWDLPEDRRRFRTLTLGHTVIMGRRTFESIGHALPDRRNLVLSRNPDFRAAGCETVSSVEGALGLLAVPAAELGASAGPGAATGWGGKLFVIGGGEIYRLFLPYADEVDLTRLEPPFPGDVTFPELDAAEWEVVSREAGPRPAGDPLYHVYLRFSRQGKYRG